MQVLEVVVVLVVLLAIAGLLASGGGLFFLLNRRSNRPSTTIDPVTAAAAAIRIRNAADNSPLRFSMVPTNLGLATDSEPRRLSFNKLAKDNMDGLGQSSP